MMRKMSGASAIVTSRRIRRSVSRTGNDANAVERSSMRRCLPQIDAGSGPVYQGQEYLVALSGSIQHAAKQMLAELRLDIAFGGMAARRIPGAPTIEVVRLRNRVIAPHRVALIGRFVERRQDMDACARVAPKVVPFVVAGPGIRNVVLIPTCPIRDAARRVRRR